VPDYSRCTDGANGCRPALFGEARKRAWAGSLQLNIEGLSSVRIVIPASVGQVAALGPQASGQGATLGRKPYRHFPILSKLTTPPVVTLSLNDFEGVNHKSTSLGTTQNRDGDWKSTISSPSNWLRP
jgi:hypothetical protein